jgi:glucuronate isomerase
MRKHDGKIFGTDHLILRMLYPTMFTALNIQGNFDERNKIFAFLKTANRTFRTHV